MSEPLKSYRKYRKRNLNREELLQWFKEQTIEDTTFSETNPCQIWQGAKDNGYAVFKHEGARTHIYRYILETELGQTLSRDEQANHACGRKDCINPSHINYGDAGDNLYDDLITTEGYKTAKYIRASDKTTDELASELKMRKTDIKYIRQGKRYNPVGTARAEQRRARASQ